MPLNTCKELFLKNNLSSKKFVTITASKMKFQTKSETTFSTQMAKNRLKIDKD